MSLTSTWAAAIFSSASLARDQPALPCSIEARGNSAPSQRRVLPRRDEELRSNAMKAAETLR